MLYKSTSAAHNVWVSHAQSPFGPGRELRKRVGSQQTFSGRSGGSSTDARAASRQVMCNVRALIEAACDQQCCCWETGCTDSYAVSALYKSTDALYHESSSAPAMVSAARSYFAPTAVTAHRGTLGYSPKQTTLPLKTSGVSARASRR